MEYLKTRGSVGESIAVKDVEIAKGVVLGGDCRIGEGCVVSWTGRLNVMGMDIDGCGELTAQGFNGMGTGTYCVKGVECQGSVEFKLGTDWSLDLDGTASIGENLCCQAKASWSSSEGHSIDIQVPPATSLGKFLEIFAPDLAVDSLEKLSVVSVTIDDDITIILENNNVVTIGNGYLIAKLDGAIGTPTLETMGVPNSAEINLRDFLHFLLSPSRRAFSKLGSFLSRQNSFIFFFYFLVF